MVPLARRFIRPVARNWYERYERQQCQPVQALTDISFELMQGESLGIIGLNGSGKSTLLQIIAGTLQPSSGHVEVSGRVAALLELGSGFDPEFTGRENVFLNAAILGLTRAEIEERYDEIVAFADIGDFVNRPVKTYSSGMVVRLAFAVQVHVNPDVLIVDEALSVGDARFQAKALTKIEEILSRGTTLLFVSHDLNAVKSFCHTAMLLDHGVVVQKGLPDDVIVHYLHAIQKSKLVAQGSDKKLERTHSGFAVDGFGVTEAAIENYGDHATLRYAEVIRVTLKVQVSHQLTLPYLIVDLVDHKGLQLTGKRIPMPDTVGRHQLELQINCCFQKGVYRFRIRLVDAPSIEQTQLISRQDDLLSFEMIDDVRDQFTGLFPAPFKYEWLTV